MSEDNCTPQPQWRIHKVPDVKDKCALCSEIAMGCHFDHDLAAITADRRGHICYQCSGFVIVAESWLRSAHLSIPTDSILDQPL